MSASTIAEIFIEDESIRIELEIGAADIEDEPVFFNAEMEMKRTVKAFEWREMIVFDQIVNCRFSFMIDLGTAVNDSPLIKKNTCYPLVL